MQRGEIRWHTFASPDKKRPVLLLTRDSVINSLNEIIVVPVTRTIRGLDTELVLTTDDGMPVACALKLRPRRARAAIQNRCAHHGVAGEALAGG